MRAVVLLIVVGACGRIGFDESSGVVDALAADAPRVVALVNTTASPETANGTSFDVSMSATRAGTWVVIAINNEAGNLSTIDSVSGNGNLAFTDAGADANDNTCDNTVELWYLASNPGGLTAITVTISSLSAIEAWVFELDGVTAIDGVLGSSDHPADTVASAPSVVTTGSDVVISVISSCIGVTGITATSSFTALPIEHGEDCAYELVDSPGSYGAVWNYMGGTWSASTIAFR